MSEEIPNAVVSSSLAAIEPNLLIAGMEGAAVGWVWYATVFGCPLLPTFNQDWHWSFIVYGLFAVVGLAVLGLTVEGLAGILESLIVRQWWGRKRCHYRTWYLKSTNTLDASSASLGRAQQWIWKSGEAYHEFSRRRLRILLSRNTAFCFFVLTGVLATTKFSWAILVGGLLLTLLFTYLWLDATKGWNAAVRNASEMELP